MVFIAYVDTHFLHVLTNTLLICVGLNERTLLPFEQSESSGAVVYKTQLLPELSFFSRAEFDRFANGKRFKRLQVGEHGPSLPYPPPPQPLAHASPTVGDEEGDANV